MLLLLAGAWTLSSASCCASRPIAVPDERPRPARPLRATPRPTPEAVASLLRRVASGASAEERDAAGAELLAEIGEGHRYEERLEDAPVWAGSGERNGVSPQ